ncbi:BA14K family protein [Limoniibacter endophyticus]|uniref:Lectin-like protein BA14k n=1 Tax=Limoniibacter endophyticus TaxID=1565040 RepID=A0A8J3GI35_9HYPH|nr:BA14K family protein [Limoniibacter endophyticus]GHC79001.1 hypothetical protein GCM10010136_31170 [Limoniibacter endophyticus]
MKKLFSVLCAGTLSLAMGMSGVVPVAAAGPVAPKPAVAASISDAIQLAQYSDAPDRRIPRVNRRDFRDARRDFRDVRRDRRDWRETRRDSREWRGHRGYRDYRRGYRRHSDGFWYPLAAFAAGAAIGAAVGNSSAGSGGSAHVNWCANRYRSYRASDNTYQPYNGPRRQCNSPY